ncbi:MAG: hypothetical protein NZM37_00210 [Sandaracinaceae bacterium]|nr:hypothetical protein [Sandaracinaceae bacterium]
MEEKEAKPFFFRLGFHVEKEAVDEVFDERRDQRPKQEKRNCPPAKIAKAPINPVDHKATKPKTGGDRMGLGEVFFEKLVFKHLKALWSMGALSAWTLKRELALGGIQAFLCEIKKAHKKELPAFFLLGKSSFFSEGDVKSQAIAWFFSGWGGREIIVPPKWRPS